jgi:hypothetical protein
MPLEPQSIYHGKKGAAPEVIATVDAECRMRFDRKITEWATDLMRERLSRGRRPNLAAARKEVNSPVTAHDELPRSHHGLEQAAG